MDSCVGIIPARAGSERLPNKNVLEFHGKPLIKVAYDKLSQFVPTWYCTNHGGWNPNIELPLYMHDRDYSLTLKIKYAAETLAKKAPIKTVVALMCTNPAIDHYTIGKALDRWYNYDFKILRSYDTDGFENGLYIIDYNYLVNSHIYAYDVHTGMIPAKGYEIHTYDEYVEALK